MNEEVRYEHSKWLKFFGWIRHISVEPTMWLYMMAYMITSVVEQDFFVYKACRVNHNYTEEICRNLKDNDTIKAEVQVTVSEFHQWNGIAGHAVPIMLALFLGNWSDRRGRKLPLILGLTGKFIYSFMIVINTLMETWDVNMIIYTASIPMAMLLGDLAIFASCFSYISDVSSIQQRTLRITILDAAYLSTMPTGVALGSYLYSKVFNSSYTYMFIVNSSLLAVAIVYSLAGLKWQTSPQQQSLRGVNLLTDFFDRKHVVAAVKTMTQPRRNYRRLHLWLFLLAMALYIFQRDEGHMSFLYTQLTFNWDVTTYSHFKTYKSLLFLIAMLIGVPTMSKFMRIEDAFIMGIGTLSHIGGRVIFATATTPKLFYVGATVAALGPIVAPVLRSIVSKSVPIEERGKIFALLAVCENAVPFFSSILYSQLYNATITTAPNSIFWLTAASQLGVLMLVVVVYCTSRNDESPEESYPYQVDDDTSFESLPNPEERNKTLA